MAQRILNYLPFTVTQGGADAFVQDTIETFLVPREGYAFKLDHMDMMYGPNLLKAWSADASLYWSLTRDTKASAAQYTDADVIIAGGMDVSLTTSGSFIFPLDGKIVFSDSVMVVEPNLYFQLSSVATGVANIITGRIWYEEVKLSEVEILRLLNNA